MSPPGLNASVPLINPSVCVYCRMFISSRRSSILDRLLGLTTFILVVLEQSVKKMKTIGLKKKRRKTLSRDYLIRKLSHSCCEGQRAAVRLHKPEMDSCCRTLRLPHEPALRYATRRELGDRRRHPEVRPSAHKKTFKCSCR